MVVRTEVSMSQGNRTAQGTDEFLRAAGLNRLIHERIDVYYNDNIPNASSLINAILMMCVSRFEMELAARRTR